jgi:neuroblastoma-amplified sequence
MVGAGFGLAKSLFNPSSGERPLDPTTQQDLVLKASHEFYDNAESGNLHRGNMKLALEWYVYPLDCI